MPSSPSDPPSPREPAEFGEHLLRQKAHFTGRWIAEVRRSPDIPSADGLDDVALADHLPALFDRLAEMMSGQQVAEQTARDAAVHGLHRWKQNYSLAEVLREVGIVSRIIVTEGLYGWEDSTPAPSKAQVRRAQEHILTFFEETSTESSRKYSELQRAALDAVSEQRRLALDSARLGWWHYDLLTGNVLWDERFAEIFGVQDDLCSYAEILQHIHPDDRPLVDQSVTASINPQDPRPYTVEYRVVHKNGSTRWVAAQGRAVFAGTGPDRHPVNFSGTLLDITDSKRSKTELRAIEERHRLAIEGARLGTFTWGVESGKIIWNARLKEMLFLPPDCEMSFAVGLSSLHPDDREPTRRAVEAAINQQKSYEIVYRSVSPDGQQMRWLRSIGNPFVDENGKVSHIHGVTVDITEERRAAEVIRSSGEKYRKLFDSIDEAFGVIEMIWDAEGKPIDYRFVEANPAFERHTGWKNAVGHTARELIEGLEPEWPETYGRVAQTGEPKRFIMTAAGMGRTFDAYAFRIGSPGNPFVALLFRDVTDQLKADETLRHAVAESEAASRAKDEFLATLSHELRTPLSAILGWAHLLRGNPTNSEDVEEGLTIIHRNAQAQRQIIEDLLDMSRIISGKVRLEVEQVDLARLVAEAVDTIRPAAEVKKIRLQPAIDPAVPKIKGDPNRLQQVLWNLLTNAVKFTPKEGQIRVVLRRFDSVLQIQVTDSGEGIAPEFVPFVFDRFRQQDATTTRRHGGLGLGLAIVKQLVELHGGTIVVRSSGLGQGTTFSIDLPLVAVLPWVEDEESPHFDAATAKPSAVFTQFDFTGIRVLVVDDEPDARHLIRRLLENCHASVRTAAGAEPALESIAEATPDIIVSDIGMPGEDGYSFIRRVRALPAALGGQIPAIALTAYARTEDRLKVLAAGFQMHVVKPVDAGELLTVVNNLLGSR